MASSWDVWEQFTHAQEPELSSSPSAEVATLVPVRGRVPARPECLPRFSGSADSASSEDFSRSTVNPRRWTDTSKHPFSILDTINSTLLPRVISTRTRRCWSRPSTSPRPRSWELTNSTKRLKPVERRTRKPDARSKIRSSSQTCDT